MPSTRTGSSTARRAAATASTWSRPSSGRRRGIPTTPTGCAARAAGPGSAASTTRGQPISGASHRGVARSRDRARHRRVYRGPGHGPWPGRQAQAQAAAPARVLASPSPSPVRRIGVPCVRCGALDGPRDGPRPRRRDRRRAHRARDGGRETSSCCCSSRCCSGRRWSRSWGSLHDHLPLGRGVDDPGRLRHVLRAGDRSGVRGRAGRDRAGADVVARLPAFFDHVRDWASTLRPAALSRSITELVDSVSQHDDGQAARSEPGRPGRECGRLTSRSPWPRC